MFAKEFLECSEYFVYILHLFVKNFYLAYLKLYTLLLAAINDQTFVGSEAPK